MSNTGNNTGESDARMGGSMTSIIQTTRIRTLNEAGDKLIAAGQQLKTFGVCTSVGTSLRAAGQHLIAAGFYAAGSSLIQAGDSFINLAGSTFGNPGTSSQLGLPRAEDRPGTRAVSVEISAQPQQSYSHFNNGASKDGNITDTGPTMSVNMLASSDSSEHGSLLPAESIAGSRVGSIAGLPVGSGSDDNTGSPVGSDSDEDYGQNENEDFVAYLTF